MRTWLLLLGAVAVLALNGCRVHDLNDGPYAFTVTQVTRDDCGLAGTAPLSTGALVTAGNAVTITFTQPAVRLEGLYRDAVQEMVLDATLPNYPTTVSGQACVVDAFRLHSETVTVNPTTFTGAMSFFYDAVTAGCACKLFFDYRAVRQ